MNPLFLISVLATAGLLPTRPPAPVPLPADSLDLFGTYAGLGTYT